MATFSTNANLAAPIGGQATLPGSASNYSPIYGGTPNVPNPIATAGQSITGDIGNLGGLYGLAGGINSFNEGTLTGNLAKNIPGYSNLVGTAAGNTQADLSGQLPADVIRQLQEGAAERGVATGSPGSQNSNAAYLQALGLNSLQLQNQGMSNLSQLISETPQAPLFDTSSFLVTPGQQQEAQTAANVYKSAPNPEQAAQYAQGLTTPPSGLPWWAAANPGSQFGPGTVERGNTFYTPYMGGVV